MKNLLTLAALIGATTLSSAQGLVNFANTAATLISAGGASMGGSATAQYNFAVFLAPAGTVNASGQSSLFTDPVFQTVAGTNVNGATAGRLVSRSGLDVGGSIGSTVDFVVRGWSANAGATWSQALTFWNNGSPTVDMYIGSSTVGNDLLLGGGAIPVSSLFGAGANQVGGFTMGLVPGVIPEPTSMVLAGLGAASLLLFRRRK